MKKHTPLIINQAELREYVALVLASRRRDALCRNLIERLEKGAEVEKGKLSARIEIIDWHYPPTWLRLMEALGEKRVQEIRKRIEAKPGRRLRIEPKTKGSATSLLWDEEDVADLS